MVWLKSVLRRKAWSSVENVVVFLFFLGRVFSFLHGWLVGWLVIVVKAGKEEKEEKERKRNEKPGNTF